MLELLCETLDELGVTEDEEGTDELLGFELELRTEEELDTTDELLCTMLEDEETAAELELATELELRMEELLLDTMLEDEETTAEEELLPCTTLEDEETTAEEELVFTGGGGGRSTSEVQEKNSEMQSTAASDTKLGKSFFIFCSPY